MYFITFLADSKYIFNFLNKVFVGNLPFFGVLLKKIGLKPTFQSLGYLLKTLMTSCYLEVSYNHGKVSLLCIGRSCKRVSAR